MTELIKIENHDGKQAVNARDLHAFLESKRDFSNWIKDRIEGYGLIENQDFEVFNKFVENLSGGRPRIEYALSLDCAKQLCMVENNERGREARIYFIECEKELKNVQKNLTAAEFLLQQAQIIVEQERRQKLIEAKLADVVERTDKLEAAADHSTHYFTVVGYCNLNKISISPKDANAVGRLAAKYCRYNGFTIDKVSDPRYGVIGAYPEHVLEMFLNLSK